MPYDTVRGSWFGQHQGKYQWSDPGAGTLTASGKSMSIPGIALPSRAGLGKQFLVTTPDGRTFVLPQTDVGPAPRTGRGVDFTASAAEKMGYDPKGFPTDQQFKVEPYRGGAPKIVDISDKSTTPNHPWAEGGPKGIIIHHTAGGTLSGAVDTLNKRGLASNYIIDRDGTVYQFKPDDSRGAHIKNSWGEHTGFSNENTVGIEVVGRGHGHITEAQHAATRELVSEIGQKYNIPPQNVFGHGEVNPGHKEATEGLADAQWIRSNGYVQPQTQIAQAEPKIEAAAPASLNSAVLNAPPQTMFDAAKMTPTGWAGSDVPQIITAGPNAAAAPAPTGQALYDSLGPALGFADTGSIAPATAARPPADNALHNAPSQAPTTFDARFQGAAPPPATLAERFAPAQFDQSFQDRATFANLPPDALTQTKLASLVQPQSGSPFDAVTRGPEALAPWQTAGQGFQPAAGTSGLVGVTNQTAALPTMADVPLSQPAQPKPLPPVTQTAQPTPLPQSNPADLFAQAVWANGPNTGNMAQDFNQQEAAIKNNYAPWNPQLGGSQQNTAPNLAKLFSGGNPFEQGGAFGNGLLAKGINAFNGNPDPNSPIGKLASLFGIGTGDIANLGGFGGPGANGSLDFGNSFSTKTPSSGIDAIKRDAAERLSLPGQNQNPFDRLFGEGGLFSGMSNGLNDLFGLGNNSLGDMSNIFDGSGFVNGMGNGMDTIGFGDFGFGGDGGGISPSSFGFGAFA